MIKAIDVCVNPFFPEFRDRYAQLGYWRFFGPKWQARAAKGWGTDELVAEMDSANVQTAGLLAFWAGSSRNNGKPMISAKELYRVIESYPGRFFGIVGLSPLLGIDDEHFAPRYLKSAMQEFGFKAAHLALHWFDIRPDDRRIYPIYEACLELDIPLIMPLGAAPPRSGARSVAEPHLLDPVIGDFLELRIVGQSVGYPWERESVYLARNNGNFSILADAPSPQYWIGDFVGFIKQGRFPKHDAGSDQVMWGSNFPFASPAESRRQFDEIGFTEVIASQLMRENAIRIFKLSAQ